MSQTQSNQPDASPSSGAAPPAPPRPITPAARRRSWGEPQVRVWWLCALLLVASIIYFTVSQWWEWSRETELLRTGRVVDAVILGPQLLSLKFSRVQPGEPMYLRFTFRGVEHTVRGILPPRAEWYVTQKTIPIHIDPEDPERWTPNTTYTSLLAEEVLALFLFPLAALLFLGAWLRHRSVLKLWQNGEATLAVVRITRQAPSAPLSRLVRCSPKIYGREDDLFEVILPTRVGRPKPGDEMWLILPTGGGRRALAAQSYQP